MVSENHMEEIKGNHKKALCPSPSPAPTHIYTLAHNHRNVLYHVSRQEKEAKCFTRAAFCIFKFLANILIKLEYMKWTYPISDEENNQNEYAILWGDGVDEYRVLFDIHNHLKCWPRASERADAG